MRTHPLDPVVADRALWTLPRLVRERAVRYPERLFLDMPDEGAQLSFDECHRAVTRLARGLIRRGACPGDRVLIMAPNCLDYVLAWFASAFAGLVEAPMNTAYFGSIFEHQVSVAAPRFAVIAAQHAELLASSAAVAASVERVLLIDHDETAGARLAAAGFDVEDFGALHDAGDEALPDPDPGDLAAILFTSGTTGPSKGVMNSHGHVHAFGEQVVALTRLTETDRLLSVGPLFHANAQFLSVYAALVAGAAVTVRRRFSASRWISQARESEATVANLVGVMMGFVHAQPPHDRDREHRLRCVLTAPTPWGIVDDFQHRFGIDVVTEDYGSTEIGLPVLCPYGVTRPAGSCGRLLSDWYDARIVDPATDEELPDGQVGEFVVRPRIPWAISSGYFNMGERTLDSRRNLWFHTGDALRRDADGWYYFVDRINDSLRRRGENISSYEVEQPILAFPDIAEVAVVAVAADSPGGEDEVMAVVVPHRGREIDPAELWIWCDERLPAFARPRFLKIVTELPKTPSEKVRKTALRDVGTAGALDRFAPDSAPS